MSNQQLDICDIHELLFEPEEKSCTFDFFQAWNDIGSGEYKSEFVEACKLIVLANLSASSIKTTEHNQTAEQSALSSLMGDVTSAAAAVVEDSPLMDTPYLDTCINTPYTPASVFTPSLAQFQNYSAYNNPLINGVDNLDDVQVASYLKNDVTWPDFDLDNKNSSSEPSSSLQVIPQNTSYETSSAEPSQVLFGNLNSDSADDSLFPPLPSDNVLPNDNTALTEHQDTADLFNSDDFTTNLFDGDFLFDDYFIEPTTEPTVSTIAPIVSESINNVDVFPNVVLPTPLLITPVTTDVISNHKRKQEEDQVSTVDGPVVKRRKFKSPLDSDDRKFKCNVCGVSFGRRYNLNTHVKTHDPSRQKAFSCQLCKKSFDRKHDLTRHIATVHNGERAFSCELCPCTFSRKDALGRHLTQKHSNVVL